MHPYTHPYPHIHTHHPRAYKFTHAHIYTYKLTHPYIHTHTSTHPYIHTHTSTHTNSHIHTYKLTSTHPHMQTHTSTHPYIQTHTCTHVHTNMCPLTHTPLLQGAAGTFQLLQEQVFAHLQTSPTSDLSAESTTALVQLMLAQAQESFCIKAARGEPYSTYISIVPPQAVHDCVSNLQ